ncbi:methylcobamide:CoM methyltransferase MtbA [Clostridium frigidicarnis]|uniref:[methyl-Co(III) methanol-specific corrinoid protein]:coenzyme M methyltransferase n=1 Tax=Clostridium frigidicarnis TaxID=84698 RepID=A0A1I0UZF8_9CLOT|nr:methylcobamide:CoM methyltransferase MtbA [Clostridium frigidicarnis]SFA69157.1 [methyl-Co(III) methanol-specific corrinoid protein]:coenzyme M methyltransferase [Clostridium frigidicarnis]
MTTYKERLFNAIDGKELDRVPCICPGGMMNMVIRDIMILTNSFWPMAHTDSNVMATLSEGLYKNGAFENIGVPFCMTVEAEAMGAKVYMGTDITEPRVTEYPINTVDDFKNLHNINVSEGRCKVVLDAIKILKDRNKDVPVIGNLTGPVSVASSLLDASEFYKDLRRKPDMMRNFMDFVTDNLIEFGKAQINAGADIITISDPSGTGEILGPKLFKEFALPYINKLVNALSPLVNGRVIVHICGRLKSIFKELNDLNVKVLSFDSITSIKDVKENVNNKRLMGNVSTLALETSTPVEIRKLSSYCIKSGVSILSPACGIGVRTSLDNIKAMVDASKENML